MISAKANVSCAHLALRPAARKADGAQRALGQKARVAILSASAFLFFSRSVGVLNDLSTAEFTEAKDPFALFELWLEEARTTEINDPEAMTLATVDADGAPDARIVLCKGVDARGLVFYTNIESAKGRELKAQPRAAALFHWKSLRRQARFRGAVAQVTAAESDAYFASRPRGQPDRRLGERAVEAARLARRSRSGG